MIDHMMITDDSPDAVWRVDIDDPAAVETSVRSRREDGRTLVTAEIRALRDTSVVAAVEVTAPQKFAVAMYHAGVTQRMGDRAVWAGSTSPLRRFYTLDPQLGSLLLEPLGEVQALTQWTTEAASVSLVAVGVVAGADGDREGMMELATAVRAERLAAGEVRTISFTLRTSDAAAIDAVPDAVELPDEVERLTRAITLWGGTVPALGTLEIVGSAYPTINLPDRTYSTLHTFFDPDAWSVCAALSYSGVPELQRESRDVIDRALAHIRDDGLVPHHFDVEEPTYIAISGSPQPGPNLFVLEAAIDYVCATGDVEWLTSAWERGLRPAVHWLLNQFDPDVGLLHVVGALWVDVFRRAGFTLDTNAMAVRTFDRVAQLARLLGDDIANELSAVSQTLREQLQILWVEDHFMTSRGRDGEPDDDHVDTENYLAVAVGATTKEQARRIFDLFDNSPLTHPSGRGTWVSLKRYEEEDCYLGNTGDSDTAMARHLWADLLARQAVGDRDMFFTLFNNVRDDLLRVIWMNERYDAQGEMIRAPGYHEYPEILDMVQREGIYGIQLDLLRLELKPMTDEPYRVRYGSVSVAHSPEQVSLRAPGGQIRDVVVHGLTPAARYTGGGVDATTDAEGVLTFRASLEDGVTLLRA